MARMSRGLGIRPVTRLKHIVDTNGGITGATASVNDVINTVDDPASGQANRCATTSIVKSIFLRIEVVGKTPAGGVDNIYMYVFKNPAADLTFPAVDSVGTSDTRKYVIHQEMLMLTPQATSGAGGGDFRFPRTLFKGVIKIPKHYQRNGLSDKLSVVIGHRTGEATQTSEFCLECIYQEFR